MQKTENHQILRPNEISPSHCLAWFYMAGDMFCCLAWTECGTLSLSVEELAQPMTLDPWVTMGITVALITIDDCNAASC